MYNWVGFVIVFAFGVLLTVGPLSNWFPKYLGRLLLAGAVVHVIGCLIRYWVLNSVYDGGDAGRYYRIGLSCAEFIWRLDFSFFNPRYWEYTRLLGTQATIFISGFVLSLIGPTLRGEFLFFALLAFFGLVLFCKTFHTNYPQSNLYSYSRWVLLWPSLWFWPGSVGKDALILLATGLVVYGYSVKLIRIHWFSILIGLALAGFVRPPVAGVMVVSIAIAHWISPARRWSMAHYIQGMLILVLLGVVLNQISGSMGMQQMDVDNLKGYIETMSSKSRTGGSSIGTPSAGLAGIPMATVNILFRPFPWEVGNVFTAAASAEMLLFWFLIVKRWQRVAALAARWRSTRLLRLAVPLTILYVVSLGMAAGNMGIIARQRIHILPLLLIWLEARAFVPDRQVAEAHQPGSSRQIPSGQEAQTVAPRS